MSQIRGPSLMVVLIAIVRSITVTAGDFEASPLVTPWGTAPTRMYDDDKQSRQALALCVNGSVYGGLLEPRIQRVDETCSHVSDIISSQNPDDTHRLMAAWYGRQDCDKWNDVTDCVYGTLKPLIKVQGPLPQVADVVEKAKQLCGNISDRSVFKACRAAAAFLAAHGDPQTADRILIDVCLNGKNTVEVGFDCREAGEPGEVAKRHAAAEKLEQDRLEEKRRQDEALAQWLKTPEGQKWQSQQAALAAAQAERDAATAAARAQWLQTDEGRRWQQRQIECSNGPLRIIQCNNIDNQCRTGCWNRLAGRQGLEDQYTQCIESCGSDSSDCVKAAVALCN